MTGTAPGVKLDTGKAPVLQGFVEYFPRAILAVADISYFGSTKYAWGGWRTVPDGITRYGNAKERHSISQAMGETHDPESKRLHAAHEAWNAMARLELIIQAEEAANEN